MSLLATERITKRFPGVVANDGISFSLEAGEVHALAGENGAGKSTLMNILYGLYRPDEGRITVRDQEAAIRSPRDAIRLGIGMVHQHFMLVPPFTVLENVVLGQEDQRAGVLLLDGPRHRVEEIIRKNQLSVEPDTRIESLSVGQQQQVEILKILYRGAEILIFDEPTAVLSPQETEELFRTFRVLTEQGKGIIFISHKLDEVLEIADRITVIRRGKVIETLDRQQADKAGIARLMVGKPVVLNVENPPAKPGSEVLSVSDLRLPGDGGKAILDGVAFRICAGEIYGIAGVEGNGQSELVQAIAGRIASLTGSIRLRGEEILSWDVRRRRDGGISHIPEDRHRDGLLLPYSLADNLSLGRHHRPPFVGRLQTIDRKAIRESARNLIRSYDIRTPSELTPANALSGGNQQKAIIARELSADPVLLLASQPTRGVDVGATEFIYRELVQAKERGKAVLLISADLDEVLCLADRIGVMFQGKIIREFDREHADKREVGFYMMGEKGNA